MERSRKFKSNIRDLRDRADLTQRALAISMGVTEATIRNWENDAVDWIENVAALCDIFACPPADLLTHFKSMRENFGITQAELAQVIGVAENTVAGWEKGNFDAAKKAIKLCELLKCDLKDLFSTTSETHLYDQQLLESVASQPTSTNSETGNLFEQTIPRLVRDLQQLPDAATDAATADSMILKLIRDLRLLQATLKKRPHS
jgi:DNA-binding XRE family transcriptional regulator